MENYMFDFFIKENFTKTIISVFLSMVICCVIPKTSEDISLNIFIDMCFCFLFFIFCVFEKIIKRGNYCFRLCTNKRSKEYRENMELYTLIDSFPKSDYNIICEFIENKNRPIKIENYQFDSKFLNSELVHKQYAGQDIRSIKTQKSNGSRIIGFVVKEQNVLGDYLFVLDEEFYNRLKKSIKKYGRISRFRQYK